MATYRKRGTRWQVRVRIQGKAATKTFRTKAQCEKWAQQKEDQLRTGEHGTGTVGELLEKYQAEVTPQKKSVAAEESRIKELIARLGDVKVSDFTASHIVQYVNDRKVSSETIRRELSTLSHAIRTGIALWGAPLKYNPVTLAREILSVTTALSPSPGRERRVTDEELDTILKNTQSVLLPYIARFAIKTGMRRGEIVGLTRSNVVGRFALIPDAKTGYNQRVPLSDAALAILASVPTEGDRYFPIREDAVTRAFTYARDKAGVPVNFHDLRHEATSRFFEMGLTIEEVALITRHSDWRTLKRYTHLQPSRVLQKLDVPNAPQHGERPLITVSPQDREG